MIDWTAVTYPELTLGVYTGYGYFSVKKNKAL
jgi:hypothetical protein